jgi:hypothetical protein
MNSLKSNLTLVALGMLSAACSQEYRLNGLLDDLDAWHGEYVTYHANPSNEVCAGNAAFVDGFVPFVAGELGIEAPQGIHYMWIDGDQTAEFGCSAGCQAGDFALAREPQLAHELVHVVTDHHGMNDWPFFTEGVAVAYDWWSPGAFVGVPRWLFSPVPGPLLDPTPNMLLDAEELHYGEAGAFVMLLLARHGPEKFVEFSQRLGEPRTRDHLESTFRAVYGSDLQMEVDLFMRGPPCTEDMFPVVPFDCAMPEVDWYDDRQWIYSDVMDCRQGDVVGGIADSRGFPSTRSVTLEVPSTKPYQLALASDGDVRVEIGACFGCPWELRAHVLEPGDAYTVDLDAGRYYVRMGARSDESPTVAVFVKGAPLPEL